MRFDFNELLRVLSAILIMLLVLQGLDLIFGFGVNHFLFIIFCITFAFTMGGIYHNILEERNRRVNEDVRVKLDGMQGLLDGKIEREGLTEEILMCQTALHELRVELGLDED